MRTIAQFMSILALAGSILLATSGFGMAAEVACASSQRELLISNHSPQDLLDWRRWRRTSFRLRRQRKHQLSCGGGYH